MITLSKKTKVNSDTLIILDDMLDTRRPYYMVHTEGDIKTEKRSIFTMKDYYSDDTENAVVMIQKLWRGRRKVDKREKQMFDMIKAFIERKKKNNVMRHLIASNWKLYRPLRLVKTKRQFNDLRRKICDANIVKIKGVSKMSRREIEMEIARQLFKRL